MLIALVPLLPLLGAAVLLLTGGRWRGRAAGWLGVATVAASFGLSLFALVDLIGRPAAERTIVKQLYEWVTAGRFSAAIELRLDPLSAVMILTITGVGLLIHLYSLGYMDGDPRFARFFGYMNLFVFFMLTLVLANNFLLLYLGWEGVGLCSYLLIGFWFERKAAADAAKKAFITTRIGDSAMLIGIIYVWLHFGSLDFDTVFKGAPGLPGGVATIMALLLFAGAVGKSAQLPLHVWLPDAMEGPTPVSALIHAATMVTAGVYLVVRTHPIFEASAVAGDVVVVVGIATAVYAGFAALAQDDIKRMLAYSTISQLGFMFFGAGLGVYAAAIFLLVAHAFFKALLFLAAGSVMHGLHDETDMMRMGGLRRTMPVTAWTWTVGAAALAGLFPLSGFFAKDAVVAAASEGGRSVLWLIALFGALLTAIYVSRATFLTFFGPSRTEVEPHESPPVMRWPLIALAVGAVLAGLLGLSATTGVIPTFLRPVVGDRPQGIAGPSELALGLISTLVALAGIGLAFLVYASGRIDWMALRARFGGARRALQRGFYVDDVYAGGVVAPAKAGSAFLAYRFDRSVIDGAVGGIARVFSAAATSGRRVQSGLVRSYALAILIGVVALLWYIAVRS